MRFSKVPKITPDGPQEPMSEEQVWSELVPRLLDSDVLAIIQALLRAGRPLSPLELNATAEVSTDRVRDHCKAMVRRNVLVETAPNTEGADDETAYFFAKSSQADSPPTPVPDS